MRRVHLVRHAHYASIGDVLTGRTAGLHLSDTGRAAAERFASEWPWPGRSVQIHTSPLERCIETAEPLARRFGATTTVDDRLAEIDFGHWTGKEVASLSGDTLWDEWNTQRASACCPNGETMQAAQERIVEFLESIVGEDAEEEVIAVSHGDMIRAAVCHVLGMSLDHILRMEIAPLSITTLLVGRSDRLLVRLNWTAA
jgi:broad specificity phosphatase PhoE